MNIAEIFNSWITFLLLFAIFIAILIFIQPKQFKTRRRE